MKWWNLAVAAALCCSFTAAAQAQSLLPRTDDTMLVEGEKKAFVALSPNPWPFKTYHPDYPEFCRTCYGGGGCKNGNCADGNCGGAHTLNGGVGHCAIPKPGISTCRKCGLFGRIFLYECKRLSCGQEGGPGCNWDHIAIDSDKCGGGCGCDSCNSCTSYSGCGCASACVDDSLLAKIERFRNRPLGGHAAETGPYTYRYGGCYGWREGPLSYYGQCGGCYESYLWGHFDDRGPLNSYTSHGAHFEHDVAPAGHPTEVETDAAPRMPREG